MASFHTLPANVRPTPVTERTRWPWFRLLWLQLQLPALLKELNPNVLLAAFEVSTLRSPFPTVLVVHNYNPFSPLRSQIWGRGRLARMALQRQLVKAAATRAQRVVFVSEWSRQSLAPALEIPLNKTVAVHHGVDSLFHAGPSPTDPVIADERAFILTVSAVLEHKNLDRLIVAFGDLLQNTQHDLDLVVAGPSQSPRVVKHLQQIIASEGPDQRVRFLGAVPPEALATLYRQAELLVLPSLEETFGLPLIEAMASGLPVLASRVAAIPEVGGDAVWYFDPYEYEDLSRTMKAALENPTLRSSMVERGLLRASQYSWDTTARKMIDILDQTAALD